MLRGDAGYLEGMRWSGGPLKEVGGEEREGFVVWGRAVVGCGASKWTGWCGATGGTNRDDSLRREERT